MIYVYDVRVGHAGLRESPDSVVYLAVTRLGQEGARETHPLHDTALALGKRSVPSIRELGERRRLPGGAKARSEAASTRVNRASVGSARFFNAARRDLANLLG